MYWSKTKISSTHFPVQKERKDVKVKLGGKEKGKKEGSIDFQSLSNQVWQLPDRKEFLRQNIYKDFYSVLGKL